ncbi:MAG: arabinofuranosyltransferase, partial [Mycobacterium sp.]|nr:arabinofuranosyltransferase [Mycobacterium sp.]
MGAVRNGLVVAAQMALAALAAVVVSVVALEAISTVEWPAFPSSNQLHALTTAGQVACLLGLLAVGMLWRFRRGLRWAAQVAAPVLLSAFVVVTL